ncbi:MAG TPA: cellulase family glycosylhydrolase [Spirochaetales bacterium]|nr:cellulase family glycosylhydrolase [Spirochaetales bacterium]HRY54321.1 cellulase family glycosylhydrolase [Spirochaetia bacterium]
MKVVGERWRDEEGRRLVLRGVNLGGDSKVPTRPFGATREKAGFYDWKGVSFVGRPFPLAEADEHFSRLKRWGLDFLRFLVTWEAVEHEGPGIYDEEYLDYVEAIAAKAGERGLSLFVDPHQDAWSRWTGGDGAPAWTLEAVGLEPRSLFASGAAILHQELGSEYPRMVWASNYDRLACATMWTAFFAGDEYAPGIRPIGCEGASLQDFLQGHYIAAMAKIAQRVARFPHVVGFDSLNEPSSGWIGRADLLARSPTASLGPRPTPWQAILAGSGFPQEVEVIGVRGLSLGKVGEARIGAEGKRAWREGVDCLWRRAGVWELEGGAPALKRPRHFAAEGDFAERFLKPFMRRFDSGVRGAAEGARRFALFVEGVPSADRPSWGPGDPQPAVDATHWYDDFTLGTKLWLGFVAFDARSGRAVLGPRRVRRYFIEALREVKDWSMRRMGGAPTLLGEFGLPFDLNGARAYRGRRAGDYRLHEKALSAYYDAVDSSLLDSTIWNYTAANTHALGDLWNGEDLSIYCDEEAKAGRSETGDPADRGGRALGGFVRPYAKAVAGEILEMRFERRSGRFLLRYRPDPAVSAPTLVFVPGLQYPRGFGVSVEGGEAETRGSESLLLVRAAPGAAEVIVRLTRA